MFHVCKNISGLGGFGPIWELNGLMTPQAALGDGVLFTDLAPTELAIWLYEIDGTIFKWQISVDTTNPNTPLGQYYFLDQSGDTYTLSAMTPFVHTVDYNSAQPYITRVRINPTYGPPGEWGNAPVCPAETSAEAKPQVLPSDSKPD